MRKNPQPGEIYRHFKGNLYRIITLATHSETREAEVVYQALYGDYQVYVRELSMFMSEVDSEKYPQVQQKYRFELIPMVGEMVAQPVPQTQPRSGTQTSVSPQSIVTPASASDISQASPEESMDEPTDDSVDAQLMAFLDARTCKERLNLLAALQPRLTDEMINTMAVVLDLEIGEGDIEERYHALKSCLQMKEKYECSRLR